MHRPLLNAAIVEQLDDLPIDEESGSSKRPPRICLLRDACAVADALDDAEIEDDDHDFLIDQAGLIVILNKDAAPIVRFYENEDDLEDRWADLCDDVEFDAEPDDDSEPEDDEEE